MQWLMNTTKKATAAGMMFNIVGCMPFPTFTRVLVQYAVAVAYPIATLIYSCFAWC